MKNLLVFVAVLGLAAWYLTAGQWMMVAAMMLIICGHEIGHWLPARIFGFNVPTFSIGFGSPAIRLGRLWGTDFQITPWLLGGYVKIDPNDAEFVSHPAWKRLVVMLGGVTMNLVMAVVLLIGACAIIGKPVPQYTVGHVLSVDAPAARAGLHDGDIILAVDSTPVHEAQEIVTAFGKHADGSNVYVLVERDGKKLTLTVQPDHGKIGIQIGAKLTYEPMSVPAAAKQGVVFTGQLLKTTVDGIGMQFGLVEAPKGVDTHVHGMVGIVQMGGVAAQQGVFSFIWLMAALNIALLVFNILPIGILDGGHVAYIVYEKISGRRVPQNVQGVIAVVSLALVLTLFAYGLYNDFMYPVGTP
jgi:regulator of sigma E protease